MHSGITTSDNDRTVCGVGTSGYQPVRTIKSFTTGKHFVKAKIEGTIGTDYSMALGIASGYALNRLGGNVTLPQSF
jgi:hypothetical protein